MRSMIRSWTQALKRVERGTITIPNNSASATATIPVVAMGKTRLTFLGATVADPSTDNYFVRLELTNSTTITATRQGVAAGAVLVSWEAAEFF